MRSWSMMVIRGSVFGKIRSIIIVFSMRLLEICGDMFKCDRFMSNTKIL